MYKVKRFSLVSDLTISTLKPDSSENLQSLPKFLRDYIQKIHPMLISFSEKYGNKVAPICAMPYVILPSQQGEPNKKGYTVVVSTDIDQPQGFGLLWSKDGKLYDRTGFLMTKYVEVQDPKKFFIDFLESGEYDAPGEPEADKAIKKIIEAIKKL